MDLLSIAASNAAPVVGLSSTLNELEAIDAFRRHDAGWVRRLRQPRLRSIACVFVPYYLFHVQIEDVGRRQTGLFAVDAMGGTLDPYRFERNPPDPSVQLIESHNRLTPRVEPEAAWPILVDKLRRAVFQTGFFRLRSPRFSRENEPLTLHLPYWVGFYADGPFVRLGVLDAVRKRFEGAKARALFETWLADPVGGARLGRAAASGLHAASPDE